MAPHIANFLLGSFGIVAAILLVGGSIALRWQTNRHRYELMRKSIESGTPLPKGLPVWLASRRQAISILACGVGLLVVGAGAWSLGSGATMPTNLAATSTTAPSEPADLDGRPRPPRPPAPSPEMEQWHSDQERLAVGQTAVGCGVILTILGFVRLGFTNTERRYAESNPTE